MLIWFSLAHLPQMFNKGTVKCFVQCHIFAHSLPGPCPNDKHPVNTSNHSRYCVKMFHSQCYLVAMVIHIQTLSSHIYAHVHIFSHNTVMLVGQKKKMVQQWMLHSKEIFLHNLLGTCAIGSPTLLYTPSHSRNNITLAIVTIFLSFHLTQKQWMSPFKFFIPYCCTKTWDCMWNVNFAHQYCTNQNMDLNAFIIYIKFDFVRILRITSIFISWESHITENNTGDDIKQKLNGLQFKKAIEITLYSRLI